MRPAFRWLAGIVTFSVGVAMFALPGGGAPSAMPAGGAHGVYSSGPYVFGGFLILCSIACAMPVPPVCRAVSAGCAILCFLLAGFAARQIIRDSPRVHAIESIEVLVLTCVIGAGTGCYTFTGRLPPWLWTIFHKRPSSRETPGPIAPAHHIAEERRDCPRCRSETWHVARTHSTGERTVDCESCGKSTKEAVNPL